MRLPSLWPLLLSTRLEALLRFFPTRLSTRLGKAAHLTSSIFDVYYELDTHKHHVGGPISAKDKDAKCDAFILICNI